MVGMYTVLPIPSSPSNDQWVSPWRAAGPPNKGQREHRVEGCRRGAMAGGGAGRSGQQSLTTRFPASAVCCTPASPSPSLADLGPSCAGGSAEGAR